MNKEMRSLTARRRAKTQIILSLSLIILVFVFYQILSNSNTLIWLRYAASEASPNILNAESKDYSGNRLVNNVHESFRGEKLIHLDLKGAPPLVSYLKDFFPLIRKLGATGILIEYEDMFPYKDELEEIRALNAYKPSEIRKILGLAEAHNLSVIPLIQTFGHFEFVLKSNKFKHLREIDRYPQVLCPTHQRAGFVIKRMIDQILEAHPKANYIHIGSDEVLHLGKCDRCTGIMSENNWGPNNLFLNHVTNVALYINKTHPGVRPIMWGDMLAKVDQRLLEESEISTLVDLMVWKYVPNVSSYITDDLLKMYSRIFKNIWIASAFKGATGVNQIVTNARYHLENHMAWMNIVAGWESRINFKGIAITGWQRYDHFSVLCELLPVAIPSLAISLTYLKGPVKEMDASTILNILQCDYPIPLSQGEIMDSDFGKCNFPGFSIFQLTNRLYLLSTKMKNRFSNLASGWFSTYNVGYRYSSPAYVEEIFKSWPLDEYREEVTSLEEQLRAALSEVYDEYTVKEWIFTHLTPIRARLDAYYNAREGILGRNVWPRRPVVSDSDATEKVTGEICNANKTSGCGFLLY